jgi:tetratricopeptide (TPR) repeat protein
LEAKGWYEDAAKMGLYAARIYATVYGPRHLEVAKAAERLARLCAKDGKYAQAGAYYDQALSIREKAQGGEHKDILPLLDEYAAMLRKTPRKADFARVDARAKSLRLKLEGAKP